MQNQWRDALIGSLIIIFLLLTMGAAVVIYQAEDATRQAAQYNLNSGPE